MTRIREVVISFFCIACLLACLYAFIELVEWLGKTGHTIAMMAILILAIAILWSFRPDYYRRF